MKDSLNLHIDLSTVGHLPLPSLGRDLSKLPVVVRSVGVGSVDGGGHLGGGTGEVGVDLGAKEGKRNA